MSSSPDRFGCVADVGWITGHTYVVYGPLLNGVTVRSLDSSDKNFGSVLTFNFATDTRF